MHVPLEVPPLPPTSGRGIYGAALSEMDALVGRIKQVADSHGKGNTLLWFAGTVGKPAAVAGGHPGCAGGAGDRTRGCPLPLMLCRWGAISSLGPSHRGNRGSRAAAAAQWVPTPTTPLRPRC